MDGKRLRRRRLTNQDLGQPVRRYVCIVCPKCCELETDGSGVVGALCPKGEEFARQEWENPLRVITTTVPARTAQGTRRVPVKSAAAVPLAEIPRIMKRIRTLCFAEAPPIGSRVPVDNGTEPLDLIVTGE